MDPYPRTWIEVDLDALVSNIGAIKRRLPPEVELALVAKADAYGHGLVPVCRVAAQHGADWIAVATVQEGVALREAGVLKPIMVMSPVLSIEAEQAVFYDLDIYVESISLAEDLSAAAVAMNRTSRIHIKVDTGLHRFGCQPEEAAELGKKISRLPAVTLVGIAQHFADSAQNSDFTSAQLAKFRAALMDCKKAKLTFKVIHMANSAGTVKYPESRGNLVRVGILAYGVDPFQLMEGELKPVMKWFSRLTSKRVIEPGERVGYTGSFVAERRTVVGTLGVGYGDGYGRQLSNRGHVAIGNKIAPVIGLVCMDQMMIDLTDLPDYPIGQVVNLIGPHHKVEDMARDAQTNVHEVVTRIMTRVPRRYNYPLPKSNRTSSSSSTDSKHSLAEHNW